MPLVLVSLGLAVAVSLVRGGRLGRVADSDLRLGSLLLVGLLLQLGVDAAAGRELLGEGVLYAILALSQLAVLGWVVANRSRPGMALIGLGLLMNAVVIGANGAMPVDPEAIDRLGIGPVEVTPGKHEPLTDDTRLAWLADVIPLPPIRTIVSVGDIVLAAGLLPLVHHLMSGQERARGGSEGGRRALKWDPSPPDGEK